ncbi:sensor domain-containing protein [Planctomonas deserti]|uniref:sensor domain-containing protein n=1 Tax=Planctomonas deserti TaxID=2144185 RepID=UPI000D337270|nr:diguanylate cyclase [Planctomonas deserti]
MAESGGFDRLAQSAPCGLLATTVNGTVLLVNETLALWMGLAQDDLVGRPFEELLTTAGRLFYQTRYLPVLRLQGEVREAALTLRGADGSERSVLASSVQRTGPHGDVVFVALFDATGRSNYERELLAARREADRSERRVRVLLEASASFDGCETEGALASALAEAARTAAEATTSAVFVLDGAVLRRVAGGMALGDAPDDGPEAQAARMSAAVTVEHLPDAARFPGLTERLAAVRAEAMSAVPILAEGEPLGVVACYFGRARRVEGDAGELQAALARQAGQVLRRIRLQERLRHSSLHDPLTELPNRAHLQSRLTEAIESSVLTHRPLALLFVDLDGFKAINDRLGHVVGDTVLAQIAERLRRLVRRGDTVARFGGDEFAIVCAEADAAAAVRVADRVREAMREPLRGVPAGYPVTASIGVALHEPQDGTVSAEALVLAADGAMYRSKSEGRDRNSVVRA